MKFASRLVALSCPVVLTACATMSTSTPHTIAVTNKSSNAANCVIVDSYEKQLASANIPRLKTAQLTIHTSPDGTALICHCADCGSKDTYAAFDQLSSGKAKVLAGNPNKTKGQRVPYLLY